MDKIKYPRCPYCGFENKDTEILYKLASNGWIDEDKCICKRCGKEYIITIKLMYYGKKVNK